MNTNPASKIEMHMLLKGESIGEGIWAIPILTTFLARSCAALSGPMVGAAIKCCACGISPHACAEAGLIATNPCMITTAMAAAPARRILDRELSPNAVNTPQ